MWQKGEKGEAEAPAYIAMQPDATWPTLPKRPKGREGRATLFNERDSQGNYDQKFETTYTYFLII